MKTFHFCSLVLLMECVIGLRHLVLIGMPNSGKTSLGHFAAHRMGVPFHDTDETLGNVRDIIQKDGWYRFREQEYVVLRSLLEHPEPSIIATGGGCIEYYKSFHTLLNRHAESRIIHLIRQNTTTRGEKILSDEWERLWEKRAKFYFQLSDENYWNDGSQADFCNWLFENNLDLSDNMGARQVYKSW